MSKNMEATKEDIIKWIKEKGDGELILDKDWTVEEGEDENTLFASLEDTNFTIGILFKDGMAELILFTDLETATLSKDERLELYRKMLILNDEEYMVKATLYGRDDEIVFRSDLDLVSLSRKELDDAVAFIMLAALRLEKILGMDENEEEEAVRQLIEFIADTLQTKSEKEVIRIVAEKTGISEEEAKDIVEKIKKDMNLKPPEGMYG